MLVICVRVCIGYDFAAVRVTKTAKCAVATPLSAQLSVLAFFKMTIPLV